jgi:hypothetical protein
MKEFVANVAPLQASYAVKVVLMAAITFAAGCNAGGPIDIVSSYGPGIKFSGLGKPYAWAPNAGEQRVGAPGLHELVRSTVEKHLAAKGFTHDSTRHAAFLINYRIARSEKEYSGAVAHGETIEVGSLVLEVLDPSTRQLIWKGIARARIFDSDTPEVRKQRLEAAMRGLMEKFPKKA